VVLPYAMAYTAPAAPAAMARIAEAMRVPDAVAGVHDLVSTFGGPTSLAELGFDRADIDRDAELATAKPYRNLREVTRDGVSALLEDAYGDQRPGGGTRFSRIELDQLTRTILASCDATPDPRLDELMTGTVMTLKRRDGSAVGGAPGRLPYDYARAAAPPDRKVEIERVAIVGRDLKPVEHATDRTDYGRAALRGAGTGARSGALLGRVFGLFSWLDPLLGDLRLTCRGVIVGVIVGVLVGLAMSASHVAPHNFHSTGSLEPRHDLVADADVADRALRLLRNGNQQ
jgi:hypothetical protein